MMLKMMVYGNVGMRCSNDPPMVCQKGLTDTNGCAIRKPVKPKTTAITVAHLQHAPPGSKMYCSLCGAEYSADHRDYFAASKDYVFTCCGKPVRLVRKITSFVEAV
jgi:hypothetical protein